MLKKLSRTTNFILIGIVVGLFVGVSIRQAFGQADTSGTARADNLTVNMSATAENGLIVANGNLLVLNGNIGIGTTTPTTSLDVVGDIKTTGSIKSNNLCIGATCINETQLQALLAVGGTGTGDTGGTVTPGTGIGTTLGTNNGGVVSGGDREGSVDIPETTRRPNHVSLNLPSSVAVNVPFTMSWQGNFSPTSYQLYRSGSEFRTTTDTDWAGTAASLGLLAPLTYNIGVRACNSAGCSPIVTKKLKITAAVVIPVLPTISSMSIIGESIVVNGTNLEGVTSLSYTNHSKNEYGNLVTHIITLMLSQSSTRLVFSSANQLIEASLKDFPWKVVLVSPKGNSSLFIWTGKARQ